MNKPSLKKTAKWWAKQQTHISRALGFVKNYFGYPLQIGLLIGIGRELDLKQSWISIPVFILIFIGYFWWDLNYQYEADLTYSMSRNIQMQEIRENTRRGTK